MLDLKKKEMLYFTYKEYCVLWGNISMDKDELGKKL